MFKSSIRLTYAPGLTNIFPLVKSAVGIEVGKPKPGQQSFIAFLRAIIDSSVNNVEFIELTRSVKANKNLLSEEGKKLKTKKIIKLASIKKIRCIIPPIALKYFTGLTDERLNEIQKEVASLNDHDATWDIDVARHAQLKADYEKVYQLSKSLKGLYQTRYNRLQTFITKTTEANTAKRDAMIKENRRKEYKATPIPQSYAAYRSMMSAQDQISDDMSQEKSEKLIVLCIYFIKKFGCELTDDLVDDIFKCTKDTGAQMDRFFALAPLASASTQHRKEFLFEVVNLRLC